MTAEEFWKSWLAIFFLAGPFLLEIMSITYSLYLSRRHLEAMKEALKNSRYIYLWGPSLGRRGLIWSLLEIAKISGMILMPQASIRIGELDPGDFKNFPPHLKHLLQIKSVILIVTGLWLVAISILLAFD